MDIVIVNIFVIVFANMIIENINVIFIVVIFVIVVIVYYLHQCCYYLHHFQNDQDKK